MEILTRTENIDDFFCLGVYKKESILEDWVKYGVMWERYEDIEVVDVLEWLQEHLKDRWIFDEVYYDVYKDIWIYLETTDDLMLIKLRW